MKFQFLGNALLMTSLGLGPLCMPAHGGPRERVEALRRNLDALPSDASEEARQGVVRKTFPDLKKISGQEIREGYLPLLELAAAEDLNIPTLTVPTLLTAWVQDRANSLSVVQIRSISEALQKKLAQSDTDWPARSFVSTYLKARDKALTSKQFATLLTHFGSSTRVLLVLETLHDHVGTYVLAPEETKRILRTQVQPDSSAAARFTDWYSMVRSLGMTHPQDQDKVNEVKQPALEKLLPILLGRSPPELDQIRTEGQQLFNGWIEANADSLTLSGIVSLRSKIRALDESSGLNFTSEDCVTGMLDSILKGRRNRLDPKDIAGFFSLYPESERDGGKRILVYLEGNLGHYTRAEVESVSASLRPMSGDSVWRDAGGQRESLSQIDAISAFKARVSAAGPEHFLAEEAARKKEGGTLCSRDYSEISRTAGSIP